MNYIEISDLQRHGKIKSAYIVATTIPGRWGIIVMLTDGKRVVLTKKLSPKEEKTFSRIESAVQELNRIGLNNAMIVFKNEKSLDSKTV